MSPTRPFPGTLRFCVLLAAAHFLVVTASAQDAGEVRPTWDCLPEETAVAVRIPNGSAVAEALVTGTKLGVVLLSDERIEKYRQLVLQSAAEEGEDVAARLAEYGFELDDLPRLLAGESGYAVLVSPEEGQLPLVVGVGWIEPGDELAQRAYEAIGRLIEEQQDAEHPPRRVDIELAGRTVMQLAIPVITLEYGEFELPDNYENLPQEEQERVWEQAYERYQASAAERVSYQTLLVASLGGRLLVTHSFSAAADEEQRALGERLEALFTRVLAAHDGEPGGFAERILATPGMGPVHEPQGAVLVEVLGDSASLMKLARAQPDFQADENSERMMSLLGADSLGPFAMRMVLDGSRLHTRLFLSAPEPRGGLARLLNQEPLPAEVPAWVPATAVSYSQFSFDLGAAYRLTKEEVTRHFPDEAGPTFQMAEAQVQKFAQISLEELLGSLGSRHIAVSFEPQLAAQGEADEIPVEVPQDRMALVWELDNDQAWGRVMQAIGGFAALAPGLTATDEQGFNGWRLENEALEGGLVSGKGYLVLAIGQGVLETTLSSLNNPPTGRDSLRGSDLFARASALVDLGPSVAFEVTDADRYAEAARAMFVSLLDQMEMYSDELDDETGEDPDLAWIEAARSLMPDDDEMENILGPAASVLEVDESGVLVRSVNELPPPE